MHFTSIFYAILLSVQPMARADSARHAYLLTSVSALGAALGRWALNDASNCSVPSKAFRLSTVGGKIVWISDIGNTDVEAIIDVGDEEFRTITITSSRVAGRSEPAGMNWTYTRIGREYLKVTRGGRETFLLARCAE